MIIIENQNNEKKGFILQPQQEIALKYLLEMKEDKPMKVDEYQVNIIKDIWLYLHSEYIQNEFYFTFNDNFTLIKKQKS